MIRMPKANLIASWAGFANNAFPLPTEAAARWG